MKEGSKSKETASKKTWMFLFSFKRKSDAFWIWFRVEDQRPTWCVDVTKGFISDFTTRRHCLWNLFPRCPFHIGYAYRTHIKLLHPMAFEMVSHFHFFPTFCPLFSIYFFHSPSYTSWLSLFSVWHLYIPLRFQPNFHTSSILSKLGAFPSFLFWVHSNWDLGVTHLSENSFLVSGFRQNLNLWMTIFFLDSINYCVCRRRRHFFFGNL